MPELKDVSRSNWEDEDVDVSLVLVLVTFDRSALSVSTVGYIFVF